MSDETKPKAPTYRVLVGMNYLDQRREPGDVVDDIPERSLPWLLRDGHVERVTEAPKKPTGSGEG